MIVKVRWSFADLWPFDRHETLQMAMYVLPFVMFALGYALASEQGR